MNIMEFISIIFISLALICVYSMIYLMMGGYALFGFLAFSFGLIIYLKNDK